jgi:hypothetical protein
MRASGIYRSDDEMMKRGEVKKKWERKNKKK